MRSLVLSLIRGLAALGTLGAPPAAHAHEWVGYTTPVRWHGSSHHQWRGGTHYRWYGGTHYRWNGGTHYYNPGYYYSPGYYNGYNSGYYTPTYVYPPPVYSGYSPGFSIQFYSGYRYGR
jgi:hypothetical protein